MKKALIAGATGMVGRELVEQLIKDASFDAVTVLVRNRVAAWDNHPRVEQVVVDFEQLDALPPELFRGAFVFCTLGTTIKKAKTKDNFRRVDHDYPLGLGQLAERYGSDGVLVVTALGANAKSAVFYNQVKGRLEADLKALNLSKLHLFQPSLLLGEREEHRTGEKFAMGLAKLLPGVLFGKYRPIAGRTVAQAMINVANGVDAPETITSNEIARIANRAP